jgi:hypothetical protein
MSAGPEAPPAAGVRLSFTRQDGVILEARAA